MTANIIDSTPVTRDLDAREIPYRFFRHTAQVRSLEQAAVERGQRPEQIIRSILFRLPDETFVMVLSAGPAQLSWPRLREFLGTSRMTMATTEEVLERTGYPPGAVSPFGLPSPIRILADNSIFGEEEISIGSGVRNTTVIMSRDNLQRALGVVEHGDFLSNPIAEDE